MQTTLELGFYLWGYELIFFKNYLRGDVSNLLECLCAPCIGIDVEFASCEKTDDVDLVPSLIRQSGSQARPHSRDAVTALPPSLIIPFSSVFGPLFPLSVLESVADHDTLRILFHFPLFFEYIRIHFSNRVTYGTAGSRCSSPTKKKFP